MSKNAFGGRRRLDQIDILQWIEGNTSSYQMMLLSCIQDAVHNYLFFGLGKNGTSIDEFYYSYRYLFEVRSFLPSTWQNDKQIPERYRAEDGSLSFSNTLTNEQIQSCCFDLHYAASGLSKTISLQSFLTRLLQIRKTILKDNREQVVDYINYLRAQESKTNYNGDMLPVLSYPQKTKELANLMYG